MRATIIRGEDRVIMLRLVFQETQEPFDLTGATRIAVMFKKHPSGFLELSTEPSGGEYATGTYEGVKFTAQKVGPDGNLITLTFDGVKTVKQVVDQWNYDNPTNQVSHNANPVTKVLTAGTLVLSGAVAPAPQVVVINEVLGKIQVSLNDRDTTELRLGKSQSFKTTVEKGVEKRIILFEQALDVIEADI